MWVIKTFLYNYSVYPCHIFFISFASVRSLLFLSFIVPFLAWNIPLISPVFLKRFLVYAIYCFPPLLCVVCLRRSSYLSLLFSGTLNSIGYIFPFLPCFSLLFFSHLFVKPHQTTSLPSCISFSLGCFVTNLSTVLQELYSMLYKWPKWERSWKVVCVCVCVYVCVCVCVYSWLYSGGDE